MNRPYLPKYVTRSNYTIELEKYCDELEKAFNKGCKLLEDEILIPHMTDEQWKEYLSKDE